MSEVRVIKRYANRKLYDTTHSRYITLEEIGVLIKEGEEIQIVDNKTKEDLTAVTMAQILVSEEKRQRRSGALPNLRGLIQQSGELIQRRITEPVHSFRSSVEESVNRLIRSGEERAELTREQIKSWMDHNALLLEELQRNIDDRVKLVVSNLDPLGKLGTQLEALTERVATLEAKLGIEAPEVAVDDATDEEPQA